MTTEPQHQEQITLRKDDVRRIATYEGVTGPTQRQPVTDKALKASTPKLTPRKQAILKTELEARIAVLKQQCKQIGERQIDNQRNLSLARTRLSVAVNLSAQHRHEMLDEAWNLYKVLEQESHLKSSAEELQRAIATIKQDPLLI